jgi:hypothetical protein
MKITDIVSEYGMNDEPARNYSKAGIRKDRVVPQNQFRRQQNDLNNDRDESIIQQQQQMRNQVRDQSRRPTGIPNRAYMQQQQQLTPRGGQS